MMLLSPLPYNIIPDGSEGLLTGYGWPPGKPACRSSRAMS